MRTLVLLSVAVLAAGCSTAALSGSTTFPTPSSIGDSARWVEFVARGATQHERTSTVVHEIAIATTDYDRARALSKELSQLGSDHRDWLMAHPPVPCYGVAHATELEAATALIQMADASTMMYDSRLAARYVAAWDAKRQQWARLADAATRAVESIRCP